MKKLTTITNTFHNTTTRILLPEDTDLFEHLSQLEYIVYNHIDNSSKRVANAKRKLKRIKNNLCGNIHCKCAPFIK